jgi:murein DD-endopeptidase MepM/ murein hydrolase activator NlpD
MERLLDGVLQRPWIGPGAAALGLCALLSVVAAAPGAHGVPAAASVSRDVRANLLAPTGVSSDRPAGATTADADIRPLRIYGRVNVDLRPALQSAGIPAADVDQYVRLVSREVSPDTVGPGDHFDVILRQRLDDRGQPTVGDIVYAGLYRTDGVNVRLAEWRRDGRLSWFDADQVGRAQGVQRPVPGIVSSNYGPRMHPILGYTRMHRGVDFRAGYGTPILAVQTGYVSMAGWAGSFGQHVELAHGGGLSTTYSHMSGIAVRSGELVQQGQVIGYVGATGLATGPHLHFELHRNGEAINPSSVQFAATTQLAGADLAGYRARLGALLSLPFGRSPDRPWLS